MATTREQRKKQISIPEKFTPRFWEEVDGRFSIAKEIRRRYDMLREDTAADSYQKDILCQRAVFISVQLETMEIEATESGRFDPGVYTQMTNALLGLLKSLKLDRKVKDVADLKAYMEGRRA